MTRRRDYRFIVCLLMLLSSAILLFLIFRPRDNITTAINEVITTFKNGHESAPLVSTFDHAAVSTDASPCASIGVDVMSRMKGSAVDAAVATLFCMGLVMPESMGLGGGSWFTIFEKATGTATVINGRETAPSYATYDMFSGDKMKAVHGVDAIAVPGELAAYYEAHDRFGRVPFHHLIQPTIDLACSGFPVGRHLSSAIKSKAAVIQKHGSKSLTNLVEHPVTRVLYKEGDRMKREDLTETLQIIQREGRNSLYALNGTLAMKLVGDLTAQGSRITLEDLANYTVRVEEAERRVLANGMTFYSNGLPGSGPMLGFMLDAVMRSFNLTSLLESDQLNDFYRTTAEVFKFAYGQRAFLGDPEQEKDVNCTEYESTEATLKRLKSLRFPHEVGERIKLMRATHSDPVFYQQPLGHPLTRPYVKFTHDDGTSAVTVMDADGNAVAVGSTINAYFGSLIMSTSTGIILNNEMDDFSAGFSNEYGVVPSSSQHNRISARKRPLSSIAPSIITTGSGQHQEVVIAAGASGGTQIPTSLALVILRTLLFMDVSLADAVGEPRIHHQLQPNVLKFENSAEASFHKETREALSSFGHVLQQIKGRGSVVMAIKKNIDGKLDAVSDWRKGGSVGGY